MCTFGLSPSSRVNHSRVAVWCECKYAVVYHVREHFRRGKSRDDVFRWNLQVLLSSLISFRSSSESPALIGQIESVNNDRRYRSWILFKIDSLGSLWLYLTGKWTQFQMICCLKVFWTNTVVCTTSLRMFPPFCIFWTGESRLWVKQSHVLCLMRHKKFPLSGMSATMSENKKADVHLCVCNCTIHGCRRSAPNTQLTYTVRVIVNTWHGGTCKASHGNGNDEQIEPSNVLLWNATNSSLKGSTLH